MTNRKWILHINKKGGEKLKILKKGKDWDVERRFSLLNKG
jgi:plasmid rolling circle replication initiator protein Rep